MTEHCEHPMHAEYVCQVCVPKKFVAVLRHNHDPLRKEVVQKQRKIDELVEEVMRLTSVPGAMKTLDMLYEKDLKIEELEGQVTELRGQLAAAKIESIEWRTAGSSWKAVVASLERDLTDAQKVAEYAWQQMKSISSALLAVLKTQPKHLTTSNPCRCGDAVCQARALLKDLGKEWE